MNLEKLLETLAEQGRIEHLILAPSKGRWQAAFRETGGRGYRMAIQDDPSSALKAAMGPHHGKTWAEHLNAPHPLAAARVKRRREFPADVEELL